MSDTTQSRYNIPEHQGKKEYILPNRVQNNYFCFIFHEVKCHSECSPSAWAHGHPDRLKMTLNNHFLDRLPHSTTCLSCFRQPDISNRHRHRSYNLRHRATCQTYRKYSVQPLSCLNPKDCQMLLLALQVLLRP